MKMTFEDYGQTTVMTLHGDLTADEVSMFRKAATERLEQQVRDFVLDIANVEFIDSRGLETLLWLQDTCAENLGQIRLAGVSANVGTILRITRLAPHLECQADVDAAVKSLQ